VGEQFKDSTKAFRLSVAPELFMNQNGKYFVDIEGVTMYFDNILIVTEPIHQHQVIMNKVIERARQYNIRFNVTKLQYRVRKK